MEMSLRSKASLLTRLIPTARFLQPFPVRPWDRPAGKPFLIDEKNKPIFGSIRVWLEGFISLMQRLLRFLIPAILALVVLWLVWPYVQSDERQVEKMHRKFISLGADRNWNEAAKLMALDYEDDWDFNREEALQAASEVTEAFLYLNIEWQTTEITVNDGIAKVRGFAKLNGSGGGFSSEIIRKVNALEKPWVFTWRKENGKPNSWNLVSVRQEELSEIRF